MENKAIMDNDGNAQGTLDGYLQGLDNKYDRKKYDALEESVGISLEGKKALDLGCGGGQFSIWLAKRGARVWGVDLDEKKVAAARLYAKKEKVDDRTSFLRGDVCEIDIGERFDLIVAKDIIEHVDDRKFLENVRLHARSRCRVVISTNNNCSLQYLFVAPIYRIMKGKAYLGMDPTHLRLYSPQGLGRLLRERGFRPIEWIGGYHIPYRLAKSIIPLRALEFLPLHFVEDYFRSVFPFDRTGWQLSVVCEIEEGA